MQSWESVSQKQDIQDNQHLHGFVDSDYAANLDNRRSHTGFFFTLFGSVVSWKSNLQSVVALSTTKTEYMAVTEAIKEAL